MYAATGLPCISMLVPHMLLLQVHVVHPELGYAWQLTIYTFTRA